MYCFQDCSHWLGRKVSRNNHKWVLMQTSRLDLNPLDSALVVADVKNAYPSI